MAKTAAERQRERREKLKKNGNYDKYKKKAAEQKKVLRKKKLSVETEEEKKIRREKDRINHAKYRLKQTEKKLHNITSPSKAFGNNQALGKAVSRAKKNLPNSPNKRVAVIKKLASQYSPTLPLKTVRESNNCIDQATEEAVLSFYANDNISSQAPGLRDFFILRNDAGKTKIQKRYLQLTLGEIYRLFIEEHPAHKIGFTKFTTLRPKHICLRHETPSNMCLCIYHENIRLLLESSPVFPNSATDLVKKIVCNDNNENCMLQKCEDCQDLKLYRKFIEGLDETDLESEVSYKQWTKSADGAIVRNRNHATLNDVLNVLENQLIYFLWHVYVKRTQSAFFANLKQNLPYGKLLIQADFSENYLHTYQDEIQSAHWQNTSSTLYTTMVYYRSNATATDVSSEPYVVISDYNHHDKYAVIVFNKLILETFSEKHPELKVQQIEFQSDGTSQHFKQKYTIFSITLNELPTTWHFSATSHGKGCIDGIGGTIKRRVREVSRARKADPRTSLEFANDAKKICPGINILYEPEEKIEAVKAKLDEMWVTNGQEIKGMPGTRKAHCFRSYASGIVFYTLTSNCEKGTLFNFRSGDCVENFRSGENVEQSSERKEIENLELQRGQWVTVEYDNEEFYGVITETANEQYQIKCLVPTKMKGIFKFESEDHAVWYKREKIISTAVAPTLINSRGFYKF